MEIYVKFISKSVELLYLAVTIFLFYRLSRVYLESFLIYMFNQKNKIYDKIVEKPRLLFHIIGFFSIAFAFTVLYQIAFEMAMIWIVLLFSSSFLLFGFGVFCAYFTWTNKFVEKYIPIVEKKIEEKYELKIKKDINIEQHIKELVNTNSISSGSQDDLKLFLQNNTINSAIVWTLDSSYQCETLA